MEYADPMQTDRDGSLPSGVSNNTIEGMKRDRETLVLTRRPIPTLKYFMLAMWQYLGKTVLYIASHKLLLLLGFLVFFGWNALCSVEGPHKQFMKEASVYLRYALWWVGLGILSSIGLGSGLHTFVLYLGPHIAMFTIKATLCGRVDLKTAHYDTALFGKGSTWAMKDCLDFGEPLYPKAAGCERFRVPLLAILHEIHWEAILWGLGTALGELPPYFVSRAAKMSGERLKKFEALQSESSSNESSSSLSGVLKKLEHWMIMGFPQYNFWIILIFASVPNPLFDLAGMICGQLLVPFWRFFIPTLIGKAIVKTHIQTAFVILLCNNQLLEHLESSLRHVFQDMPAVSHVLNRVLLQLETAKQKYDSGPDIRKATPWKFSFSLIWNTFVWIMLIGFFSSIVNATAQKKIYEQQRKEIDEKQRKG